MLAPERIWWKPLHRMEKSWLAVAFAWCVLLTVMMPLWFLLGRQNVPTETHRTTPADFQQAVADFVADYEVGRENGVPIVAPPPGSDVYIQGQQWRWYPILQLQEGQEYRLHLSSLDVQHGFSLQPINLNLQILPGYEYVARISPTQTGDYSIVCNEYCLIGHHLMTGKLIVSN